MDGALFFLVRFAVLAGAVRLLDFFLTDFLCVFLDAFGLLSNGAERADFQFGNGECLAGVLRGLGETSTDWTVGSFFHPATYGSCEWFDLFGVREVLEWPSGLCLDAPALLRLTVRGVSVGVFSFDIPPLECARSIGRRF